jgi:type IV secretory pathway VirB4 component
MSEMQEGKPVGKPAQSLLTVAQIRDGVVVMKNGSMRAVLMVSSVNFALKSEEEQNALIYAYQDFLNALDFSVQIVVASRKTDITPYLALIEERRERQHNELLRLQMAEYSNFVQDLVQNSNVMSKTFYVVVPFSTHQNQKKSWWQKILGGAAAAGGNYAMPENEFLHNRAQLYQRLEQVAVGLRGLGLRLVPLSSEELVELFYVSYNPMTSQTARLRNIGQLDVQENRQ